MVLRGMSSQPPTKEELETRLGTALAEVNGLREQLGGAQVEIRLLRAKLDALVRRIFGKKSEQLNDAQLHFAAGAVSTGPGAGKRVRPPGV